MKVFILLFLAVLLISGCTSKNADDKKQDNATSIKSLKKRDSDKIETIIGATPINDLKYKSSNFLRYSRNQFFAKKGYVFNDSDLMTFFNHQDWYTKKTNQTIRLDSSEKNKVKLLKSLENNYGSVEYRRIIYKFDFNDYPLFYIGWNPQTINNRPDEFFDAGFAILDTSMNWTLNCNTIPPEYLVHKSKKVINLIDDSYYVRKDKIEFKNIDKGCVGGEFDEIIIHLAGPSDDYNDIILGFNKKGEFSVLFDEFVTIDNILKINDSILEFRTTKRCDFIGTMFCDKKYQYNTITKKVIDLPYDFDKVEIKTKNRNKVNLYFSSNSAIYERKDSIVGQLEPQTEVEIIKFLNKKGCYMIKSDSLTGWINNSNLQNFIVSFAD